MSMGQSQSLGIKRLTSKPFTMTCPVSVSLAEVH